MGYFLKHCNYSAVKLIWNCKKKKTHSEAKKNAKRLIKFIVVAFEFRPVLFGRFTIQDYFVYSSFTMYVFSHLTLVGKTNLTDDGIRLIDVLKSGTLYCLLNLLIDFLNCVIIFLPLPSQLGCLWRSAVCLNYLKFYAFKHILDLFVLASSSNCARSEMFGVMLLFFKILFSL